MTPEDRARLEMIAGQIAIAELLRVLVAEICFDADPVEYRKRIARFETKVVDGLNARSLFPPGAEQSEQFVKDAASHWVSSILASAVHPRERPSNDGP